MAGSARGPARYAEEMALLGSLRGMLSDAEMDAAEAFLADANGLGKRSIYRIKPLIQSAGGANMASEDKNGTEDNEDTGASEAVGRP